MTESPPPPPSQPPPPPAPPVPQAPSGQAPPPPPPPVVGAAGPPGGGAPGTTGKPSGLATAAMVCGIVGLVVFVVFVVSVVALVLGLVAASRAKKLPGRPGLARARAGWIMGIVGVALFGLFLVAAAGDGLDEGEVGVGDLDVGDCVDLPADRESQEISALEQLDCDEPHDAEVFHLTTLDNESAERPELTTLQAEVVDVCLGSAWEDYIGVPYLESELADYAIVPSDASWVQGDRDVACMVIEADGSQLTGTVEGAGR